MKISEPSSMFQPNAVILVAPGPKPLPPIIALIRYKILRSSHEIS